MVILKELVEVSWTGVYSHLKELRQGDFIEYQSARRLKVYSTTAKFKKYFGIDGDTETLKSKLFSRMRQSKTKEKLRNANQNHRIYTAVVGNYSNDYDVQCQLDACKTYPVITDSERGEMICGGCGVLLVQNMADSSHENTGYTLEGFAKSARTGPATSLTIFDMGLSTVMGMDKDSTGKALPGKTKYEFKRLRMWDQRSKSKKTARLSKAFTLLYGMKTKLGIPNNVVENAAYIYRKAVDAKLTRGRTMASLVSASLYAACREHNIPRTLDDIANAGNTERRTLSRDLRTIIQKLELNLKPHDTTMFITKISNNMSLKEKTKRDALEILKLCEEKEITAGKHPVAQAAASLYIACIRNGEKISQKKFSVESGVSDVTIRNRVALINETLNLA